MHNPLQRGMEVKVTESWKRCCVFRKDALILLIFLLHTVYSFLCQIVLKLAGDVFEVELPDDHEVKFPNHERIDVINYIKIAGDFRLTSFKIC